MGWLDSFTGKAAKEAGRAAVTGQREAGEMADWGGQSARKRLEAAGALYKPMTGYGQQGVNAYMTGVGLGPGGMEAATEAFRGTPGYQFALDQGEDSVMRNAAARGMLAGGNTSVDLMRYGTGFADQTYQNYLKNLKPVMDMYGTGIQGQAGALGDIARSYQDEARARSGYLADAGSTNAQSIMGQANAQAQTINSGLDLASKLAGMPSGMPGTSYGEDLWKRYAMGAQRPTYG
jgi:hypothetical protein